MHKIPPHDITAEQAVLGSLLLENSTWDEIAGLLNAEDFYNTGHQMILKTIQRLIEGGQVADILTVSSNIAAMGMTERTGGTAYIAGLTDSVVSTATAKAYAGIVKGKSIERQIISESTKIIEAVYDSAETSKVKLEEAQKTILNLSLNNDKQTLQNSLSIVKKTFADIEERNKRGGSLIIGHTTGLRDLDSILSGLNPGDLIIIAARPGMGKTALALNIAVNVAFSQSPVVIFSLEMPADSLMTRIFAGRAKIDSRQIRRGQLFGGHWEKLAKVASEIGNIPLFIDDKPDITIQEIRAKCRKLKKDHGLGLVVVDYLQLMKVTGKYDNREQQVAEISRTLKIIAREIECPVIGLSQLNRQVDSRPDRHPMLSDLRESGAIEQDADVIAFIYRDEVYNKSEDNPEKGIAEIDIAKHRNGAPGRIKTIFDAKTQTFRDMARLK